MIDDDVTIIKVDEIRAADCQKCDAVHFVVKDKSGQIYSIRLHPNDVPGIIEMLASTATSIQNRLSVRANIQTVRPPN